jgi:hypothetical protein
MVRTYSKLPNAQYNDFDDGLSRREIGGGGYLNYYPYYDTWVNFSRDTSSSSWTWILLRCLLDLAIKQRTATFVLLTYLTYMIFFRRNNNHMATGTKDNDNDDDAVDDNWSSAYETLPRTIKKTVNDLSDTLDAVVETFKRKKTLLRINDSAVMTLASMELDLRTRLNKELDELLPTCTIDERLLKCHLSRLKKRALRKLNVSEKFADIPNTSILQLFAIYRFLVVFQYRSDFGDDVAASKEDAKMVVEVISESLHVNRFAPPDALTDLVQQVLNRDIKFVIDRRK